MIISNMFFNLKLVFELLFFGNTCIQFTSTITIESLCHDIFILKLNVSSLKMNWSSMLNSDEMHHFKDLLFYCWKLLVWCLDLSKLSWKVFMYDRFFHLIMFQFVHIFCMSQTDIPSNGRVCFSRNIPKWGSSPKQISGFLICPPSLKVPPADPLDFRNSTSHGANMKMKEVL